VNGIHNFPVTLLLEFSCDLFLVLIQHPHITEDLINELVTLDLIEAWMPLWNFPIPKVLLKLDDLSSLGDGESQFYHFNIFILKVFVDNFL
jgi:hypothetical protein